MFYVVGLGLGDCRDITVKGLEIVKKCERLYLEAYTSILTCGKEALEQYYNKQLILADRDLVEQRADEILEGSQHKDIGFLVVGDPFGATTHIDLVLRAKEKGIKVEIVHNASILSAVGCCGLQLYTFGETVSIPYWTDTWNPDSFFDKILNNYKNKLHTLCLLDIKIKEPTPDSLTRKNKVYMPPKFMSVSEASWQLLEIINRRKEPNEKTIINPETLCVGLARIGSDTQQIVVCNLHEMSKYDLGGPLHSMVIIGPNVHPIEHDYLKQFKLQS